MIVKDPVTVEAHHIATIVVESHKTGSEYSDNRNKKVWHLMKEYWFTDEELRIIWFECQKSESPLRCKAMITHTCKQETNCWKAWVWLRNNLFWVYNSHTKRFDSYPSRISSIQDWLDRYNKFRHKNSCEEMITRSKYCVSWCNDRVPNCKLIFNKFIND